MKTQGPELNYENQFSWWLAAPKLCSKFACNSLLGEVRNKQQANFHMISAIFEADAASKTLLVENATDSQQLRVIKRCELILNVVKRLQPALVTVMNSTIPTSSSYGRAGMGQGDSLHGIAQISSKLIIPRCDVRESEKQRIYPSTFIVIVHFPRSLECSFFIINFRSTAWRKISHVH